MQDPPVRRSSRKRTEVDIAVKNLEHNDSGRRQRRKLAKTGANTAELQHGSEAGDGSGGEEEDEADEEWLEAGAAGGGGAAAAAAAARGSRPAAAAAAAGGEFADGRWVVVLSFIHSTPC